MAQDSYSVTRIRLTGQAPLFGTSSVEFDLKRPHSLKVGIAPGQRGQSYMAKAPNNSLIHFNALHGLNIYNSWDLLDPKGNKVAYMAWMKDRNNRDYTLYVKTDEAFNNFKKDLSAWKLAQLVAAAIWTDVNFELY